MGEQIPCPVCTLFLHPGMTLEEHLETHPKDQVIKALVALASGQSMYPATSATQLVHHSASSLEARHNTGVISSTESKMGFIAPSHRNVMIFNRQSTMVYHSTESDQRMLRQPLPLPPPALELYDSSRNGKFFQSPTSYCTSTDHNRSHNIHDSNDRSQNNLHSECPFEGISNQLIDPQSRKTPQLQFSSRTSSPRPTPSPSVLRYAESPITAHYVERENGDFIVQETPRHVVECIEKDDGEFSVTEKVIKSPPSVVQFTDGESIDPTELDIANNDNNSCVDGDHEPFTFREEPHICQDDVASTVTVLSNVKLAPRESLDLMENIMGLSSKPPGVELLWNSLVEPDAFEVKQEIENIGITNEGNYDKDDFEEDIYEHAAQNKSRIQPSSSAATSVIRLATNLKNSTIKDNTTSKNVERSSKSSKHVFQREQVKRPYRKMPKKLVVKFKQPPSINVCENNDESCLASTSKDIEKAVQKNFNITDAAAEVTGAETLEKEQEKNGTTENLLDRSTDVPVQDTSDKEVEKMQTNESTESHIEKINDKVQEPLEKESTSVILQRTDSISLVSKDEGTMREKAKHNMDVDVDDPRLPVVIVHEPSLLDEIPLENNKEKNLEQTQETEMKAIEFTNILDDSTKGHKPDSYTIHLSTINSIPDCADESSPNRIQKTANNDSELQRDFSGMSNSFPSTSFSKPSSFGSREQTDFHSCHSFTDYPFSFMYTNKAEKACLSPAYPSEEQSWHKLATPPFQPHPYVQSTDVDTERNSYLDLDACKKNINTDTVPSVDTFNIHTDEKMPAKGEISEQESNGEIDLSWGQTFCNDSQRFQNQMENYGTQESGSYSNDNFFFCPQNLTTDTKAFRTAENSKAEETANIRLPRLKGKKTTSNRKTFRCDHCPSVFPKLKERNSHLIQQHNYKRVNRRLIRDFPPATITTGQIEEISSATCVDSSDVKKTEMSALTTVEVTHLPRTKYDSLRAGVYRMLMNFNLSVLQQKKNVDVDKALFDSKSFCCYTCKRDFISVKSFDEHLAEHPAECFTCSKKFCRWTYLSLHLKRHLGWKDFGCTVCSKKFVIRSALIEHMRMHTGIAPLKCKFCDKHFKRYSNLTQHKRVCHQTKNKKKKDYVCHCGEVLPSKARFFWHKETHDTKPKCCPYCRDRFVHSNSLRRHIRLAHSDKFCYAEPAECSVCNQVYAKTSLKAHMSTHSMDTQHECMICNKSFSTKWNLKIHSWVHANRTAKPFKCDLCVKAFVREIDYKNHMNAHKQIKPYTCEYCGCKFIRKYNYMRHSREHHGQKKFGCDLCGKLFHRHYYLIEHRRTHTGERPFLCTICGKSSTTKTNHNKHLKIHHSRDPFTTET